MLLNLTAVMDGIATLCASFAQNVYAYPVDTVTVPCVVVGYPTRMLFDMTFARGGDDLELPVWYIVGKAMTKDTRDALSAFLDGGVSGAKHALDGVQTFGNVRVTDAAVEALTINAADYMAVKLTVEVI